MQIVTVSLHDLVSLIERSEQRIISALTNNNLQPFNSDKWFNLTELCNYLPDKPARQTIYGYVAANTIPYNKPAGQKKLKFLKSEIDAWLKTGRNKTNADTEANTDDFLQTRKRKTHFA